MNRQRIDSRAPGLDFSVIQKIREITHIEFTFQASDWQEEIYSGRIHGDKVRFFIIREVKNIAVKYLTYCKHRMESDRPQLQIALGSIRLR